jgi:[acyl-carrier-protein] S-malonyltransferase
MTTVWMFPGQGSQYPGMGRELLRHYPVAGEVLAEAEELAGIELSAVRERGPLDAMTRVDVVEPLLAAISIGYAQVLLDAGLCPDVVAGYSAGEVAALYVAGVLSRLDALRVATIRGRVLSAHMERDARMVAVSRLARAHVASILASLDVPPSSVEVAGWNAPDHVTIVGLDPSVRLAERLLVRQGAETSEVAVSGLWHSRCLSRAAEQLHEAFQDVPFQTPRIPILTSARGERVDSPSELRQDLASQVALAVQWQPIVEKLRGEGVREFIEVGASRTLLGILRRNWMQASEYTAMSVEGRAGNLKPLKRLLLADNGCE